jgi:excisionase family DNA binding protein
MNCSTRTVLAKVHNGQIPAIVVGRYIRIYKSKLMALLAASTRPEMRQKIVVTTANHQPA